MGDFREALSGSVWLSELTPIATTRSSVQSVEYYNSEEYGRVLVINDELQHVEAWAPFYHEIITHLPCSFIKSPKTALIIGGGSLFAAEELLKYDSINKVDLVDHDMAVIQATIEAYPERKNIISDGRLNLIEDTYQSFLIKCKDRYDIVVNDCFDLFMECQNSNNDYYSYIESLLSDEGICSDLIYRSIYDDAISGRAINRIPKRLNRAISLLAVPEYPGTLHILTMWGKNSALSQKQARTLNISQFTMLEHGDFLLFNPKFMSFYLYSPPYLSKYII